MEKYLKMSIKAVIAEFPEIGTILNSYGIGCVTCSVGTCLLKDIIGIHDIPQNIEAELMKKLEAVINGETAQIETAKVYINMQTPREAAFSEPIQRLVDEHTLIKRLLAFIPALCSRINEDLESNRDAVLQSVEFIKLFADKFHHAKEEDILFAYAKGNSDIIDVMLEDHKKGRYYVKSVLLGLETGDASFIAYSLKHYMELLSEHIKKEDEILYPWIEKGMSQSQLEELKSKFDTVDSEFGSAFYERWKAFINSIE